MAEEIIRVGAELPKSASREKIKINIDKPRKNIPIPYCRKVDLFSIRFFNNYTNVKCLRGFIFIFLHIYSDRSIWYSFWLY